MTSLHDASGGHPIDPGSLLEEFLGRLEGFLDALRQGRFDVAGWTERQLTNGRPVQLERPDGTAETVRAIGVDGGSGALVVADPGIEGGQRHVLVGEIRHLRIGGVV
jgi:biotin-(acetyl-CoA carboxylase) ligase